MAFFLFCWFFSWVKISFLKLFFRVFSSPHPITIWTISSIFLRGRNSIHPEHYSVAWQWGIVLLVFSLWGFVCLFMNISSCFLFMKKILKLHGFFGCCFLHGKSSTLFRGNGFLTHLVVWTLNWDPFSVVRNITSAPQLMPYLHSFFEAVTALYWQKTLIYWLVDSGVLLWSQKNFSSSLVGFNIF